jgi:hypothetical protein
MKKVLFISNLSFLALFAIVAWNNRLAADDYHFLWNVHTYGVLKGTVQEYNYWSTRYASVFLNHFVLSFIEYKYTLFIFGLIEIIAFVLSLSMLLKAIFSHFFHYPVSTPDVLNISILFTNGFFFSCMGINETWFWLCSACTYIWSITFFFLGGAMLFNKNINRLLRYALILISFTYIGGSSETSALIILSFMVLTFVLVFIGPTLNRAENIRGLSLALLAGSIALLVLYFGHGNDVREQYTNHVGIGRSFLLNFKLTAIVLIKKMPFVLPFALLFAIPFTYVGRLISLHNNYMPKGSKIIMLRITGLAAAWVLLLFIQNWPIAYLLGDIGPARAMTFMSLTTFLFFVTCFVLIGMYSSSSFVKYSWTILFLCLGFNIYNAIHQFNVTSEYAKKYDERMNMLDTMKEQTGIIELEPLPPSGMVYSADHEIQFIQQEKGLKATLKLKN